MEISDIIRDYFVCLVSVLSIIGIPIVFGYLSTIINRHIEATKNERIHENKKNDFYLGSFVPIVNIYIQGVFVILFVSISFLVIFITNGIYDSIIFNSFSEGSFIRYILSLIVLFSTILASYIIPITLSVQNVGIKSTLSKDIELLIKDTLYSKTYFKYTLAFFTLSFCFSVISYLGSISIIAYILAILLVPAYILFSANILGIMRSELYKIQN